MPSWSTLAVFAGAALALLVVPGPAVLYIVARSSAQGSRAGALSVLGVHAGSLVHVIAAVVGLSAVVMASAAAFTVVKVIGGAYLIWLGLRTIFGQGAAAAERAVEPRTLRRLFVDGFVVNVLNPKVALFFLAFLPQFIDPDRGPVWSQTLMLGLAYTALGIVSDGTYALAAARIGRWLQRRPAAGRRRGRYVEGGLLIGLGAIALAAPHRRPAG